MTEALALALEGFEPESPRAGLTSRFSRLLFLMSSDTSASMISVPDIRARLPERSTLATPRDMNDCNAKA